MEDTPRVGVIGSGYVGLVTGSCFAKLGFNVILGDIIPEKVEMINAGKPPIYEEGLESLLQEIRKNGKLRATTNIPELIKESDIIFIAVGTPSREDGSIDLKYIETVAQDIGEVLKSIDEYKVIVDKSTVVPGTTQHVIGRIIETTSGKKPGVDFGLGMNPEFLKEGVAIEDFMNPDRVVIGAIDDRSYDMIAKLYTYVDQSKVMKTSIAEAELIKYASNSFLALKISFINEIANYSDRVGGIDVNVIAKGMGLDTRISPRFLRAGIGFGGSCFPKDVKALIADAKTQDYEFLTLQAAINVNKTQPYRMIEEAKKRYPLENARVAVLGLAFKPGTDDMREAVAIPIIHELIRKGSTVIATDPIAIENAKQILPDTVTFVTTAQEALKNADLALLITEWPEYTTLTPQDYVNLMTKTHKPVIIDGRRFHDPVTMLADPNIQYKCIGYSK